VLAARNEAVVAMFPRMTNNVVGSVTHREGWFTGLSAADRAAVQVDAELLD
jgi:hypothetical protein